MKTRYKIIPVAIISTMAIGGVAYLINESKKITLVTKEDTTMEEFADKLDIDIKDLKKWNKDLDDTLLEGQEVTIKTDLDRINTVVEKPVERVSIEKPNVLISRTFTGTKEQIDLLTTYAISLGMEVK